MIRTENWIEIAAPPGIVFRHAADIDRWPEILPHYRYVDVLFWADVEALPRRVSMGARRLRFPVHWTSLQWRKPELYRVRYRHIAGVTRGMDVEWRIEPGAGGTSIVTIDHALAEPQGLLRWRFAQYVAARFFVRHIADRTLAGIKRHIEANRIAGE